MPPFSARRGALPGLVVAVAVAACAAPASPSAGPTSTGSSATPAAVPSSTPAATPTALATAAPPVRSSPPSQSDSAWGRLWDALPAGFPVPEGAARAIADEPVSAAFDVATPTDELATLMQAELERANFSTLALSGPLEDGTIVIDSVGATTTACRVETTMTPRGPMTRLTVRYGAACPLD